MSRVGVVIVNHNAGAHLRRVLESLEAQTVAPHRVVVVDNASDDGSVDGLEARFPRLELVRSRENLGFAAGNNLAVGMCDDCELVALLNPDAFPEPRWLELLVAAAAAHPDYAFFGSRLLLAADTDTLDGTGDEYHVSGVAWRRDQGAPAAAERDREETFSVCAAAALYRRDAFLAVGGFDESFFCYYEDTDLAFRLRLAGHRCLYVRDAVVHHVGSVTAGLVSSFTIYHSARNQLWTFVKNMPAPLLWLYLPQHVFMALLMTVGYTRQGVGRAALAGKVDALRELPRVLGERKRIQGARVVRARDLRRAMAHGASVYAAIVTQYLHRRRRGGSRVAAAARPAGQRSSFEHLDGLRGLAALFVVLHHAWLTAWPDLNATDLPLVARATSFLKYGHFAVVVFIVLSGFCLALPVARDGALRGGARAFLVRRARRLLPPYYASFALTLLLIWTLVGSRTGTHWDISVPPDWRGYVGNGLLLGDVLGGGQVNHVWWSVALEWQIYLVFPLLVACWARYGAPAAALLGFLVSTALAVVVSAVPSVGPVQLAGLATWFVALFALGMLGAALERRLAAFAHWGRIAAVAWLGILFACAFLGWQRVSSHLAVADLIVGAATICVVAAGIRRESRFARVLSARSLLVLGGFSYSLYLVHAPLLQVIWQYAVYPVALGRGSGFTLLIVLGLPFVLATSYLFFLAVERPFLSASHRARLRPPASGSVRPAAAALEPPA